MKVQPIRHKYQTIEVPEFLLKLFRDACPDFKETEEYSQEDFHDALVDFISEHVGYFLEEGKDKVIEESWAIFLQEWHLIDKSSAGYRRMNWFDLTIENKTYRILWFGWTRDLAESGNGYMLCYEITNYG